MGAKLTGFNVFFQDTGLHQLIGTNGPEIKMIF